jgi:hypothetical protein
MSAKNALRIYKNFVRSVERLGVYGGRGHCTTELAKDGSTWLVMKCRTKPFTGLRSMDELLATLSEGHGKTPRKTPLAKATRRGRGSVPKGSCGTHRVAAKSGATSR